MIIDFTIKNYRSFKDEIVFSLEASGSKGKSENIALIETKNGKSFKLLKTAVIYGANASGKSNVIKAFWAFRQLILSSFKNDINDEIILAEPFELSTETQSQPTEFKLNFIAWDKQQYIYSVAFTKSEGILSEELKYYPALQPKTIFKRAGRKIIKKNPDFFSNVDTVTINPKRLFLSELGNTGEVYWEELRNYFVIGTTAINSVSPGMVRIMAENAKNIFKNTDEVSARIREKVTKLIQVSDLGIKGLDLVEVDDYLGATSEQDDSFGEPIKRKRFVTYHNIYDGNGVAGTKEFDLIKQGSTGTFTLVGVSAEIIRSLEFPAGRPLWIDEIDTSLHPYLCRFLINLYHHPKSNPNNSQLIFATHETTLLDRNNFRKDQIWITSKDKYGVSNLYSVYDLDLKGIRDSIPFDKWYMSGKFGGLPKIKELDFIFDRE